MLSFPLPVVITGMADTDGELGNLEPLRRGMSQRLSMSQGSSYQELTAL